MKFSKNAKFKHFDLYYYHNTNEYFLLFFPNIQTPVFSLGSSNNNLKPTGAFIYPDLCKQRKHSNNKDHLDNRNLS